MKSPRGVALAGLTCFAPELEGDFGSVRWRGLQVAMGVKASSQNREEV